MPICATLAPPSSTNGTPEEKRAGDPRLFPQVLQPRRAALRHPGRRRRLLPAPRAAAPSADFLSRPHRRLLRQQADRRQDHHRADQPALRIDVRHRRRRDVLGRPERGQLRLADGRRGQGLSRAGADAGRRADREHAADPADRLGKPLVGDHDGHRALAHPPGDLLGHHPPPADRPGPAAAAVGDLHRIRRSAAEPAAAGRRRQGDPRQGQGPPALRLGQRVRPPPLHGGGFRRQPVPGFQPRVPGVRRGRRLPHAEPTGARRGSAGSASPRPSTRCSGSGTATATASAPWRREIAMPWDWPVEVNYLEAKAFCNWKAKQTGLPIRLPTEDEWYRLRDLPPDPRPALLGAGAGEHQPRTLGLLLPGDPLSLRRFLRRHRQRLAVDRNADHRLRRLRGPSLVRRLLDPDLRHPAQPDQGRLLDLHRQRGDPRLPLRLSPPLLPARRLALRRLRTAASRSPRRCTRPTAPSPSTATPTSARTSSACRTSPPHLARICVEAMGEAAEAARPRSRLRGRPRPASSWPSISTSSRGSTSPPASSASPTSCRRRG